MFVQFVCGLLFFVQQQEALTLHPYSWPKNCLLSSRTLLYSPTNLVGKRTSPRLQCGGVLAQVKDRSPFCSRCGICGTEARTRCWRTGGYKWRSNECTDYLKAVCGCFIAEELSLSCSMDCVVLSGSDHHCGWHVSPCALADSRGELLAARLGHSLYLQCVSVQWHPFFFGGFWCLQFTSGKPLFVVNWLGKHKIITYVTEPTTLLYLVVHDIAEALLMISFYPSFYKKSFPDFFIQTAVFFSIRSLSLWMTIFRLNLDLISFSADDLTHFFGYSYTFAIFAGIGVLKYRPLAHMRLRILNWVFRNLELNWLSQTSLIFLPPCIVVLMNWLQHLIFFWSLPNNTSSPENWAVIFLTSITLMLLLNLVCCT